MNWTLVKLVPWLGIVFIPIHFIHGWRYWLLIFCGWLYGAFNSLEGTMERRQKERERDLNE